MNSRALKKTALCIAMGACLATLSPLALAQSATGAVAGRASAGDQVLVSNPATGLSRSVTVDADGSYRLAQLPVGDYTVQLVRNGQPVGEPLAVNVSLGGTTTLNLGDAGNVLNTVTVVGARVVNRVDVYSTESATNITREELTRLPVDQNVTSVALLAPGVVSSGATFGGLSFGGSSVAENVVYINGLNVTDPYRRQGFSSVPFGFYEEFQVKTGGYSAEFGRSTGGVINAVTRSGTNELHGGIELTLEPADWSADREDRFHTDGTVDERDLRSRDDSSLFKTNLWASGPIIKDKLFLFAMYEMRDGDTQDIDTTEAFYTGSNNDFWGGKLDWRINDNHLLEFLAFSDKGDSVTTNYGYEWDTDTLGESAGTGSSGFGGDNWSLTYTGHITDTFVAKAMYGENERSSSNFSPLDGACSIVDTDGTYDGAFGQLPLPVGCHPTNSSVSSRIDTREAARLDFEWTLGNHLLRFGADQEVMDSNSSSYYPGDGISYIARAATPGGALNGTVIPAGVTAIIDARRVATGSPVSVDAQAFYLEDTWSVTPNFLLNLGVRFDKFHNKMASGATFAKTDFGDMIAPRLGFSWDMKGDGTTKFFGNAGRYYIPLTNELTDYFGGGTTDEHTYYALNGWNEAIHPVTGLPYLVPDLGVQIGPVNTDGNAPAPDDPRTIVDRDLKQVFQDEFILGFQQAFNPEWSYGVNATYRKVTRAVEDARINHVEGCGWYSGDWPVINPGESVTLWCPDTEDWVQFDSSQDGYIASYGDGPVMGYKKPRRTYKAVEFQLDRAWDDRWAFNASYIWSKSEGNLEGPVNSDTGFNKTNLVQHYDHPANNERFGVLFNDHRHQFKLRGSYKFSDMWSMGATFSAHSGGPITAFGVVWPNDARPGGGVGEFSGGGTGWLCEQSPTNDCSDPETRQLTWTERGAFGRMPWVKDLSANITFTPFSDIDLKARFSVYNLLDDQTVLNVHSRYESTPGAKMPYFGQGTVWQSPRYMQLVVSYAF